MSLWQRLEEWRNGRTIDIVATSFTLWFKNIAFAQLRVEGNLSGGQARWSGVERVDVCEGFLKMNKITGRGGYETMQDGIFIAGFGCR